MSEKDREVECPECEKVFGRGTPFNTHWGRMHEGPTPDSIDTSRDDSIAEKISETVKEEGKAFSEGKDNPNWVGGKVEVECEWCGDFYPVYRSEVEGSRFCGRECLGKWRGEEISGNNEHSQKIKEAWERGAYDEREESEYLKKAWEEGKMEGANAGNYPTYNPIEVKETGHTVDSRPEKEVDLLLHDLGIEYSYGVTYDLNTRRYTPDFVIGDVVLEVKGWPVTNRDHIRASEFLECYPRKEYIVYALSEDAKNVPSDETFDSLSDLERIVGRGG